MEIKKSPNNPYTMDNLKIKAIHPYVSMINMSNWYLEQIYQIELELKGQLNKEYREYLEYKHDYLVYGLYIISLFKSFKPNV